MDELAKALESCNCLTWRRVSTISSEGNAPRTKSGATFRVPQQVRLILALFWGVVMVDQWLETLDTSLCCTRKISWKWWTAVLFCFLFLSGPSNPKTWRFASMTSPKRPDEIGASPQSPLRYWCVKTKEGVPCSPNGMIPSPSSPHLFKTFCCSHPLVAGECQLLDTQSIS